jgi:hypothetical protein
MLKPETQFKTNPFSAVVMSLLAAFVLAILPTFAFSQQKDKKSPSVVSLPSLTRSTTRNEVRRLGYGGAITILGAPSGSITIEGWNKSEVDVTADIELRANSEEDLTRLALVNSFVVNKDGNNVRIMSTGTHDKLFMKKVAKDFPKNLLGLPWKIDYRIRVPMMCDLEIDAGRGPIKLSNVDGAVIVKAVESEAQLTLSGGILMVTVAAGKVNLDVPVRSWRGQGVEIRLARGDMTVQFPPGFSGDINADVLRSGKIEYGYAGLAAREDTQATERSIKGRSGAGGTVLTFTVGDGTINFKTREK